MWRHIGACRFIWNYMLNLQEKNYEQGVKHLSGFSMINLLKPLKNDGMHEWLHKVSSRSLQRVCSDLDGAYQCFFSKKSGFPKFKSRKRSKPNFPIRETIWFTDKVVTVEKLGKVRYKTDLGLPFGRGHKFTNPRISNINGKWMLSFGMECENQARQLTDVSMGIDLGVKDLAIAEFNGECFVFHNINKSQKMRKLKQKLKHTQRSISRKYESNKVEKKFKKTKNIEREEANFVSCMHAWQTFVAIIFIKLRTH